MLRSIFLLGLGLCAGLLPASGAADGQMQEKQPFNVPAGKAERTLRVFAEQSRQSAVFSTDMVRGVSTHALQGDHTAAEALELMLAGTRLIAFTDHRSGALVIRRAPERNDLIVELPPYIVEEPMHPPWRYAAAPGLEVLSRCADDLTLQLIDRHHHLHELLALILPKEFQGRWDTPVICILYGDTTQPVVTRDMVELIRRHERKLHPAQGSAAETAVDVRFMPNYRFHDHDSMAMFFVLEETRRDPAAMALTPGYLRHLLTTRTPTLPAWFIEGMIELYDSVRLSAPPLTPAVGGFPSLAESMPVGGSNVVSVRQSVWISESHTKKIREIPPEQELPSDLVTLLPLSTLFAEPPVAQDEAALRHRQVWRSQSALFIRWALDPNKVEPIHRIVFSNRPPLEPRHFKPEALWEFVARASVEPVTEALFRECFGQDYEELEARLRLYLRAAVNSRNSFELRPAQPPNAPKVTLRDATGGEVGRLRGELQRLEIGYIREFHPQLTALYVEQARRALRKAHDAGERDPRLLASLGLCECDAGDDAMALPWLEAAIRGGTTRPRVHYEMARILYAALRTAHPEKNPGLAESEHVLDLLLTTRKWAPPLPEAYELAAEIWLRSETRLGPGQFAVIEEGLRLFPRHTRLTLSAAILHALHGHNEEARALVERGLQVMVDPADRERLLKLRAAIARKPSHQAGLSTDQ